MTEQELDEQGNPCDATDPSNIKLTAEQAIDMAIETYKAREVVYEKRIEELKKQVSDSRLYAIKIAEERNRLAYDALGILSANGICTPEKGYVEEPHMLALDIKSLARERDELRALVAEMRELFKDIRSELSHDHSNTDHQWSINQCCKALSLTGPQALAKYRAMEEIVEAAREFSVEPSPDFTSLFVKSERIKELNDAFNKYNNATKAEEVGK